MIRYLLDHVISVFVTVGILVALGILAYFKIPSSLLPDIPIPQITVKFSARQLSAQEVEKTITEPLRIQLAGVAHLKNLQCTSQDGSGKICLTFEYGARMDLAFIETNEKVDAAMNNLPKDLSRPTVTKVNASDIPVFNLMICPNDQKFAETSENESRYLEMSDLVRQSISPRLEQLSEIAMVDVSGLPDKYLRITVDRDLTRSMGIDENTIETAFKANNIEAGSATIKDQSLEYNVRMISTLQTPEDVGNIYLSQAGRILKLKDVANISYSPTTENGIVYYNGKKAISLAVIKQPEVKMDEFQKQAYQLIENFRSQYPQYLFKVTNDQAQLLKITMDNLIQNLWLGLLLIFFVSFVFLHNVRLPLIVGVSMMSALAISFGVLYIFHISMNIISLVGLILSVGMMIDNSLIVTDDITQYYQHGYSSTNACIRGTNEVITPMLSSMLTTIVVFLPLLFMNGMSGEIFHDQAFSVSLSLMVSYIVAILFLPVLYKTIVRKPISANSYSQTTLMNFYDKGISFIFRHKAFAIITTCLSIPLCCFLFHIIKKQSMPELGRKELMVKLNWAEGTSFQDNKKKTISFINRIKSMAEENYAYVGKQQFLLGSRNENTINQTEIYFRLRDSISAGKFKKSICQLLQNKYPDVSYTLSPPESVIEDIFPTTETDLCLNIFPHSNNRYMSVEQLNDLGQNLRSVLGAQIVLPQETQQLNINLDRQKMAINGITPENIQNALADLSGDRQFSTLHDFSNYVPVSFSTDSENMDINSWIETQTVKNLAGNAYPLKYFISLSTEQTFKNIESGLQGKYIPIGIQRVKNISQMEKNIQKLMEKYPELDYNLSGSVYQNRKMFRSLILILFISIILMYLIMTAQFESFLQPLILLTEIPVDMAAGLIFLMLFGETMNIMSAIGLIVTCGVVVNDSILKVNVINELREQGVALKIAIHEAGRRRVRAIVMTSLTSIFALVPILPSHDLGSEMQKPFAVAMIGAMLIGTLFSLFFIPLFYWLVYRNSETENNNPKVSSDKILLS